MPVSRRTRQEGQTPTCTVCGWPWCNGDHSSDVPEPTPTLAQRVAAALKGHKWEVAGSNGRTYTVVWHAVDGSWTCTCPAFGFGMGRVCKHIALIKARETPCNDYTN